MTAALESKPTIDARYEPCWLSWVGAATGCLKSLGVACDTVDVAGQSGYAFRIGVHEELCPSGPTVFDWQTLIPGVWRLGRSTVNYCGHECHCKGFINERTIAHSKAAFEVARAETAAGRPCVIWGAYMPEFAVCVGTDDGHYLVESFRRLLKQPQPPIKWDELNAPGGLYVLGFPTAMAPGKDADRSAIHNAVKVMQDSHTHDKYAWGLDAYDLWIAAIRAGKLSPFGTGYNAACWAEARRSATLFVERIAARCPAPAQADMRSAHEAIHRACDALCNVEKIFKFGAKELPSDMTAAIDHLTAAQSGDRDALTAMKRALAAWKT